METTNAGENSLGASASDPTVLFVDDERDILGLFEAFCGSEYRTLTAAGAEEALEAYGPAVDLVFVDRQMPEMSGEEVVRKFREQSHGTPVVFVSATDPDHEPSVDYEAYLKKPVDKDELQTTIARHVS